MQPRPEHFHTHQPHVGVTMFCSLCLSLSLALTASGGSLDSSLIPRRLSKREWSNGFWPINMSIHLTCSNCSCRSILVRTHWSTARVPQARYLFSDLQFERRFFVPCHKVRPLCSRMTANGWLPTLLPGLQPPRSSTVMPSTWAQMGLSDRPVP